MNTKSTLKVSVMGISFLFFSFLFLGSNSLYAANGGDDCDNEITVSGHVKHVISNWGVQYAWKIKGTPNGYGARFYDNGDKLVVKLDELVKEGEKIFVTLKMRNYNSSYSGAIQCKVYESEDGYTWSYNKTIQTEVKSYYVEKMFSVDGDTKYLKFVNGSSHYHGSPDFLIDGVSFSYTYCDDPVTGGTYTVCSQVNDSRDDAEEAINNGEIDIDSDDLELIYDNSDGDQIVGMRFNGLGIPQGATITNAFIQFTADATIDVDPCNLNIYGEASDNAAAFSATDYDISSRPKTGAYVTWSPEDWMEIGDDGDAQQTDDISAVIQEVVNRGGYSENSSIAIIIDGIEGKRTAMSYDGSDSHAPILCITFQTGGCQDSDNDGVCDEDDLCEGSDDNIDVDHDGTPDGCDDCINEVSNSGNAYKVIWNCGVYWAGNLLGAPDDHGAKFYDHGDRLVVKLEDVVDKDQKIMIRLKRRDYQSSFDGPVQLKVYESKHGYCWSYNKTITTEVKSYYVDKMFSVDDDTKYLKLVNGSSCYSGSPDFLVDAISYDYKLCDERAVENYDACSKIASSSDDAEETISNGAVNLTSGDIELTFEGNEQNGYENQVVGLRFLNLNIPQGASVNNAYIQFTSEATVNQDPSVINIYGEASDNSAAFTNSTNNISNRYKTSASVSWSPIPWTTTGSAGSDQKTLDIASLIQEIVNRPSYTSSSAISIIIEGIGKRTAVSFDANGNDSQAAELCVNYSASSQGGSSQGMVSNGSGPVEMQGETLSSGLDLESDPNLESIIRGEINDNNNIEDAPERMMLTPTTVNVFPIPASRDLQVDLINHEGRPARISVYNQIGQLQEIIDIEVIPASPVEMNVGNYMNGAYYMNIEIENERSITKKFIVNRSY